MGCNEIHNVAHSDLARPDILSKDSVLSLLSNRLGCSVDSLRFIFERPTHENRQFHDITIPNRREAIK